MTEISVFGSNCTICKRYPIILCRGITSKVSIILYHFKFQGEQVFAFRISNFRNYGTFQAITASTANNVIVTN